MRSVLAVSPLSRRLWAGLAAVAALGLLDVLLGADVILAALLVIPPLVVALTARWGDTAIVAVLATAVVAASPSWNDGMPADRYVVALLVVAGGGAAAVAAALVRLQSAIQLQRFRLLVGVADAADATADAEAFVRALLDLLVPAFADVCSLDAVLAGEHRRLGARVAPGMPPEAEGAVLRRRMLGPEEPRGAARALRSGETGITEFDDGLLEAVAATPEDLALLRGLGLRMAVNVPLRTRGRVVGVLSCATAAPGLAYSEADVRFAEVLAGRVALALDNLGLLRELTAAEEQLGAVVRELAEAVTVTDASGQIVYANAAAVELLRVDSVSDLVDSPPGEVMDRFAVFDEDGRPVELRDLPGSRVVAGEPDAEPMLVRNVVKATGEERWLLNKVSSIRDGDGRLLQVVNVIEDVTEVKRAERGQRLLARASEALAGSLDYAATLQRVAEVAVSGFADWAAVDMEGRGGVIEQVAVAHADPAKVALAHRLRARYPVHASEETGLAATIRDGSAELTTGITDEALAAYARDEEHLRLLREVGFASVMLVPLQAGSETLGALTFVNSDPGRPFGRHELELAEELGRRAGVAVLNARLYTRRTAIANALQSGLMPPALPQVPGWSGAVLYRPAGELNEVGGDFYDVFRGPDAWMLVIGDIAGQGAEAATRTSLARFTARTAAELSGDVSRAVMQLNATLRGEAGLPLCTLVCARLDPAPGGGARLTMASAGHPPPLRVRGREVTPLGDPGTIAGAFDDERWPAATVDIAPGDVVVFYTDGVLDAVGESDRFGEERLREALRGLEGSVEERLAALHSELQRFQRGPQRDDTTVLVLHFLGHEAGTVAGTASGDREAAR